VRWVSVLEHLDGHEDGGEDVVEVVGDAAGEGADAFESLGAEVLLFESFAIGDIAIAAAVAEQCAVGGEDGDAAGEEVSE
jgi:hypothetical protein